MVRVTDTVKRFSRRLKQVVGDPSEWRTLIMADANT